MILYHLAFLAFTFFGSSTMPCSLWLSPVRPQTAPPVIVTDAHTRFLARLLPLSVGTWTKVLLCWCDLQETVTWTKWLVKTSQITRIYGQLHPDHFELISDQPSLVKGCPIFFTWNVPIKCMIFNRMNFRQKKQIFIVTCRAINIYCF